ncbi:MAG: hypothetical protein P0S96_05160 [Simkaniaceae bacterium]|nr:hypothetical protein [Candidatus Sacchlamyda saccharinae]
MHWVLALLLLASCQRHSQWQYTHVRETTSDSTRIQYRSKDPVQGIDIEMIHVDGELTTYLQVHSEPLKTKESKTLVVIGDTSYYAPCHKGKQRVQLTDVLQTMLISSLTEGNPITLELSGYRENVDPARFQKVFARIEKKAPSILKGIRIY